MKLSFVVPGLPQPAGSKSARPYKRADGRLAVAVRDANPKAGDWKAAVRTVALGVYEGGTLLDGPLRLDVVCYRPRPANHYGERKGVRYLKASAPLYPTTKPDSTKLVRAIEDALNAVVWVDDSRVVAQHVYKLFGEPARAEITIETLDAVVQMPQRELIA